MSIPVTLIPGDGIGPSIAEATVRILAAAGADIQNKGRVDQPDSVWKYSARANRRRSA